MITAENVTKMFGKGRARVTAVKYAGINIGKGERIYIHGPSGAGKSTFLQILCGLSVPSGGSVKYDGRDIYALSDARRSRIRNRNFGFVFQMYHLLPELTVLDNVMMPVRIKGGERLKSIRQRATELLITVGLKDRLKHKPSELSGGEGQRTAIARALINYPDVLFCDEPTGNLDSVNSLEIYRLIKGISERNNMSVVVVSHQGVEKDFYDTEYFMRDGQLSGPVTKEKEF